MILEQYFVLFILTQYLICVTSALSSASIQGLLGVYLYCIHVTENYTLWSVSLNTNVKE